MSTRAKMSLAEIALALRDEQLQARIVHYKAELETSPELDVITAGVVAELKLLQQAHGARAQSSPPPGADRAQIEIELISNLKQLLGRLFRAGELTSTVERKIAEASKRFARLFFESELCERIKGGAGETKTMRYGAQALYLVLARNQELLARQLDAFVYESADDKDDARRRLEEIIKDQRNAFLGATTPELNALMKHLTEMLKQFFAVELPPVVGELAWEVVKEARLSESRAHAGYKNRRRRVPPLPQHLRAQVPAAPGGPRRGRHARPRARQAHRLGRLPRRDPALRRRSADLHRHLRARVRRHLRLPLQRRLPRSPRRLARAAPRGLERFSVIRKVVATASDLL